MDLKLTTQDVWLSTLIFVSLGALILPPLMFVFREEVFARASLVIGASSAVFWGVLATVAIFGFWKLYYQYFFPGWVRWLAPLDMLLYGVIGLGLWWLAIHIPGSTVLWFVILGGIEGILEHILGIYALGILEKVPWLQGLPSFPIVVFSFFEYVFYWSLVAWLAFGLTKLLRI
jgi:hypothetical protein